MEDAMLEKPTAECSDSAATQNATENPKPHDTPTATETIVQEEAPKTTQMTTVITSTIRDAPHPAEMASAAEMLEYGKNLRSGKVAPPTTVKTVQSAPEAVVPEQAATTNVVPEERPPLDSRIYSSTEDKNAQPRTAYTSSLVTGTSSSNFTLPHTNSNPVENIRRVKSSAKELEPAANSPSMIAAMSHSPQTASASVANTLSEVAPRAASVVEYLAQSFGFDTGDSGAQEVTSGVHKQRVLRVRLSMDDPTIDEVLRRAHQLFVAGETLQSLRAAGVTAQHLMRIGVTYEEWHRCGHTVRDLGFMGATWRDVARMGFCPSHMTKCREGSGPSVLAGHPFSATFDDLERDLGLTIDEAVFSCHMTTADFSVLGEDMGRLIRRGFNTDHVTAMKEPEYNFKMSLAASEQDCLFLFPENNKANDAAPVTAERENRRARGVIEMHRHTVPIVRAATTTQHKTNTTTTNTTASGGVSQFKFD